MTQPTHSTTPVAAQSGELVINLCSSTTPMALVKPTAPELARFTFFVSRRREEGRERFRLHMGYFDTREEAEHILTAIRDLYPAAWVGDAPGKRLKLPQRPDVTATSPTPSPSPAPVARPPPMALRNGSNVREVLAELAAAPTATRALPAAASFRPAAPPAPRVPSPPGTAPAAAARKAAIGAADPALARIRPVRDGSDLSDSQVLKVLERRRSAALAAAPSGSEPASAAAGQIAIVGPEDTQTWRDIKAQLRRDAAVHFAVQLNWSVTPIDLAKVPGLAIFNAYTLYKIEGNRDGRKWYGLRLGFFSDALAAKQVALYVRSEFTSVAVVPVSATEREQAKVIGAIDLPAAPRASRSAGDDDPIRLIDDDTPARPSKPAVAAPRAQLPEPDPDPRRQAGGPRGPAQSLEETLEILGASQLAIDDGHGERINLDVRAPAASRSTSTFSKLLDRLTERLRS